MGFGYMPEWQTKKARSGSAETGRIVILSCRFHSTLLCELRNNRDNVFAADDADEFAVFVNDGNTAEVSIDQALTNLIQRSVFIKGDDISSHGVIDGVLT